MATAVSARDPRVVRAAALLREPGEQIVLDGPELIAEAVASGLPLELVLAADPAAWSHLDVEVVPAAPDALRALGALGQPAEVAAIAQRPAPGDSAQATLVLAGVSDAGNVGSILRTFVALGGICRPTADKCSPCVAVRADCADPFSRRALRAAAGASLHPLLVAPIQTLQEVPNPRFAAVTTGGKRPEDVPREAAIVLGNERDGLSEADLAACDARVTIPAEGFESLNVAAAAAILLYTR